MRVKELIKLLETHPQDAKVVVFAVESDEGSDDITQVEFIELVHYPESHGADYFTPTQYKKEKKIKVVRLW